MLHHLLTAHGVETTLVPACTRDAFPAELSHHTLGHFARHTNYLRTDPASSHFLLADGPLTADELARVPLPPARVRSGGRASRRSDGVTRHRPGHRSRRWGTHLPRTAPAHTAPWAWSSASTFVGRIGPLTLGSALAPRERTRRYELPEQRPIVG